MKTSTLKSSALVAAGLVLAMACAVLAGSGEPRFVVLAAMGLVGLLVLSSPSNLLSFIVLAGLVITGLAQLYVPGARVVRWLVPAAAMLLLLYGLIQRMQEPPGRRPPVNSITAGLTLLLILSLVSMLINFETLQHTANALQGYFQVAPLFIALILVQWTRQDLDLLPKLLLAVAVVQLPFALHQLVALVPGRQNLGAGVVAVDIISGTFGGSRLGGGANALLALFQVITVAGLLAMAKEKQLATWKLLLAAPLLLSPMLFNAAKVIVLYVPLVFFAVYWRDALERPLRFIGASLAMIGMVWILVLAIASSGPMQEQVDGPGELLSLVIERQTAETYERDSDYAGLSRWTALVFWTEEHLAANPAYTLLGHGPSATRVQSAGLIDTETLAETRYGGLEIGVTAIAALLWEVGVVGCLILLWVLISALLQANQLATFYAERDPYQCALFRGLTAAMAVTLLSIFHKDFLVYHLPFQTLLVLLLGYIVVSHRAMQQQLASSKLENRPDTV